MGTWRDFTLILAMVFFVLVVLMLPHLNPPAQEDQASPPGNVVAHIVWPEGNIDVDLWLMGPGEMMPVGYSHKAGILWNLLRDDTGTGSDHTGLNYENAYTRGTPEGEYIINVHCYSCAGAVPLLVKLEVQSKSTPQATLQKIVYTEVTLRSSKEEVTMVRFKLNSKGSLVPGSLNHFYTQLRSEDHEGDR